MAEVPEIDLMDAAVLNDPFTAYERARATSPVARLDVPGFPVPFLALTRHEHAKSLLADPRFQVGASSFMPPQGIPERCLAYMRTMSEKEGPEHTRLRKLVAPAFSARRSTRFRPRIEAAVERLLDDLPGHARDGAVDLIAHFARPLPMDVICELVGIAEPDRARWREYGAAVASGIGSAFAEAVPGIVEGAKAAVERSREAPGDNVLADLVRAHDEGDRLTDVEMVTLVWHLVLAGQTPTLLIGNAVEALLAHPDQLAALRAEPELMPGAVEELMRWCGPQLLSTPRFAREEVVVDGVRIEAGSAVSAAIASANRDPAAFADPDRLDVRRVTGPVAHIGFGHGPHFCLGASIARVQTEVALDALLRRFPSLALAGEPTRAPDGGTWRLAELPVSL
ncbi:cytochrome P450 [Actinomycetes bacterium KLBMP 9759]